MGSLKTNHRPSLAVAQQPHEGGEGIGSRDQPIPFGLEKSVSGLHHHNRDAGGDGAAAIAATDVQGSDAQR